MILGKGSSADDVDPQALRDSFVIGINDAALVGDVDISIFHDSWVLDEIRAHGVSSDMYLTSIPLEAGEVPVFRGEFMALTQENSELMYQRLFSDSLVVEEIIFMTALRVALKTVLEQGRADIFLVGFDFSTERGFSRKVNPSASGHTVSRQKHMIESQEQVFLAARQLLAQRGVRLHHVGYRSFSDLTPGAFSERTLHLAAPRQASTADAHRVHITAELTTNHLGDVGRAKEMMRLAKEHGADSVKFQMRDVETFYRPEVLDGPYPSPFGDTFRDYRLGLELDDDQFREIDAYAGELGITWFASVLDRPSLDRAMGLGMRMIKLPGTISRKRDFLADVAGRFTGDLVFSTGMTSPEYVDWILSTFSGQGRLYLLHTNSAYPTPIEDCNIAVVKGYAELSREHPRIIPGYSSHDEGWFGSALAVSCGARMVEKHVKLGSSDWVHFDSVALDLSGTEFGEYVAALRRAEIALGDADKRVTPSEHHKY